MGGSVGNLRCDRRSISAAFDALKQGFEERVMPVEVQEVANKALDSLLKGKEAVSDVRKLINAGVKPPDRLTEACFGVRQQGIAPAPETLETLLKAKADPNGADSVTKGPLIHKACWEGSVESLKLLLEYRANMEAKEPRMKTPPLNTALAGGNAGVCLELLNRNCDVSWTHEDGATPLHVATAWIASSHNSQLRMPPMGEEPRAVIAMMLHNGVDPTQTEGMTRSDQRGKGMTPLETFRREIAQSPWRKDAAVGPMFDKTAKMVHELLEQGEEAVKYKLAGNKAFKESRFADALKQYADGRKTLEKADIRGHHVAVLFSNEAACYKKLKDWDKCVSACDEGLRHYGSQKIRTKLEDSLKEAVKEAAAEARGEVKPEKPRPPPKPPSKLETGFLAEEEKLKTELYPKGSVNGGTGKSPGPYICGFNEAMHAGFVDGCDGDKDTQKKAEQALDRQLVKEGLLDPEFLATSDNLDLINRLKKDELASEKEEIERLRKETDAIREHACNELQKAVKSKDEDAIKSALERARKAMVKPEHPARKEAEAFLGIE